MNQPVSVPVNGTLVGKHLFVNIARFIPQSGRHYSDSLVEVNDSNRAELFGEYNRGQVDIETICVRCGIGVCGDHAVSPADFGREPCHRADREGGAEPTGDDAACASLNGWAWMPGQEPLQWVRTPGSELPIGRCCSSC